MVKYLLFLSSILLLSCSGNHNSDMKKEIKDEILSEISHMQILSPGAQAVKQERARKAINTNFRLNHRHK